MHHARDLKAGEVKVGDQFRYASGDFVDGEYVRTERIAVISDVTLTKKGRVKIVVEGVGRWSNGPLAPNTRLQS